MASRRSTEATDRNRPIACASPRSYTARMALRPHGVLETSLYVTDLDRAVDFYRRVLGLRLIAEEYFPGGRGAALQVGSGPSVLLLFVAEITRKPGDLPMHGTTGAGHTAFRIETTDMGAWRERLRECDVTIEKEFAFGKNPPSIYFRDPDGNSLELAVTTIWDLKSE